MVNTGFRQDILLTALQLRINGSSTATCFMMPVGKRLFLITARHVLIDASKIELYMPARWGDITSDVRTVIMPNNSKIDIAAIEAPPLDIKPKQGLTFGQGVTEIGGEAYIVGYPYGIRYESPVTIKDEIWAANTPLVKKSIVSGMMENDGVTYGFYLDGHNNPGFSGGPCIAKRSEMEYNVFGVVSGYVTEYRQVRGVVTDNEGKSMNVDVEVPENSGIIVGYNIGIIKDAIRRFIDRVPK